MITPLTPLSNPTTLTGLIPKELWESQLVAVPASPLSLAQTLESILQFPSGTSSAELRALHVIIMPNGDARITVQFSPK